MGVEPDCKTQISVEKNNSYYDLLTSSQNIFHRDGTFKMILEISYAQNHNGWTHPNDTGKNEVACNFESISKTKIFVSKHITSVSANKLRDINLGKQKITIELVTGTKNGTKKSSHFAAPRTGLCGTSAWQNKKTGKKCVKRGHYTNLCKTN